MFKKYIILCGVFGVAFVTPLSSAHAGFQFTAPAGQVNNQQPVPPLGGALLPQMPDMRIEGAAAMPTAPVQGVSSAPTSLLPTPNTTPVSQAPKTGLSSLMPTSVQPVSQAPRGPQGYAMAVGFGKDLPLVTALRQVVPQEYTYVLDDSVPMASNVSWEGGRPWDVVLNDMLAPLGLNASVSGHRVSINNGAAPQIAAATIMPKIQPRPQPVAYTPAPVVRAQTSMVVPRATRGAWIASRGDSLRNVLEEWSNQAGSDLFWSSDYDYPLAGEVNISGSFEEAVQTLLQGFEQARPKPIARLHPNLPHGPAVLVVETRQSID
ncbi:MAG: hypothetical protein COB76_00315 [Alphaproteobacteria bacterium]|nr:MAG: hypothetical protein COB76_00315 [Alphaproteobacteria bacterium]